MGPFNMRANVLFCILISNLESDLILLLAMPKIFSTKCEGGLWVFLKFLLFCSAHTI